MRVMLIYSNRTRLMEPAPPIGLSYVATAARQAGHDVRFVDLMMSREPLADLRAALNEFQPEVVDFSGDLLIGLSSDSADDDPSPKNNLLGC
jgi:hypothetical protein